MRQFHKQDTILHMFSLRNKTNVPTTILNNHNEEPCERLYFTCQDIVTNRAKSENWTKVYAADADTGEVVPVSQFCYSQVG